MAKKLIDFFGILSDEEGGEMLKDLKRFKAMDLKMSKQRVKELYGDIIDL